MKTNSRSTLVRRFSLVVGIQVLISGLPAFAAQELEELSLEQLMNVEVTSAARKKQTLGEVAGAMFVISAEDIRRSGVTSIAEALRMVPGVHVGRIDDTRWAVTARGFNDQLSNKLLVMMDGRHIYTPDFAGVFWSDHMPLIDNVERIEVIRGPGATVWGSNAVNGVINIISRSARDTQGLFLQARGGNRDMAGMTARYGDVTDSGWFYRLDFHSVEENLTDSPLDLGNADFLEQQRGSFRVDGSPAPNQTLRLEGSYYEGNSKEIVQTQVFPAGIPEIDSMLHSVDSKGGWLMADWRRDDSESSHWNISSYVEQKYRDFSLGEFTQNTFSLQIQRRQLYGENHDVSWGFGSRFIDLPFDERSSLIDELPIYEDSYTLHEFFLQDEVKLSNSLALTVGAKLERSEHVDWEFQPNIRLSWQALERTTFWASASRAARTPSSGERGFLIRPSLVIPAFSQNNPGPLPVGVEFRGNHDFESEQLVAIEGGIKGSFTDNFEYDLALFNFEYDDLLGGSFQGVFCHPSMDNVLVNPLCMFSSSHLVGKTIVANKPSGSSQGAELAINWYPTDNWRLMGSFSLFNYDLDEVSHSPEPENFTNQSSTLNSLNEPEWISYLRSEWTINNVLELDLTLRAVDESEVFAIDSYTTADLRLEWKPRPDLRFELIGHNLLDRGHREFGSRVLDALPSRVFSGAIARVTWAP